MKEQAGIQVDERERLRLYILFGVACSAIFIAAAEVSIVATALPALIQTLDSPINWVGWVLTAYQLGITLVMPLAGRLSDEWGHKRVFLASVGLFTLASFLCSFAPDVYWLIFFRFLQALGGGSIVPSATGLIVEHFPKDGRDRAIGIITSIFPLGAIIGPAVGGLILESWSWREIFLINVPVGIAILIPAARFIPPPTGTRSARLDLWSAALLGGAILGTMLALNRLGEKDIAFFSPVVWGAGLVGLAAGALFIWRQGRVANPTLEVELLFRGRFAVVNGINFIYGSCLFAVFSFVPLYGQEAYGFNALKAGALLTIRSAGAFILAMIMSFLLRRTGYRLPMILGFLAIGGGLFLTASPVPDLASLQGVFQPNTLVYLWLALGMVIIGFGIGMVGPSANNAILDMVPERVAAVAGLRGMFRQVGGVLGTSVIVLILSRAGNPALGLARIFEGFALLALLVIPFVFLVPERRESAVPSLDRVRGDGPVTPSRTG